ncbi:CoA pyrophosphatase [Neiella marina]|uniref:CoA pyrophosphatase n=1 Tax=Neiella holothuriorum TaxID=2870530 RepID=A0ABS7ELC6_9GAMM|nr:CoA pyrophosphatase [Neiella holothuriorum]MBW8192416.1 CoA pyrophosphatase [Neiella holothuriorum]
MTRTRQQFLTRFSLQPLQIDDHKAEFQHRAAVVIPLFEQHQQLHVLFTQRAPHLRHHGGQISFPGGRYDAADGDLATTAWRECQEEIGVTPDNLIGALPKYVSNSGFAISPYLGWFKQPPKVQPNPSEVDFTFAVPLVHLMNPQHHIRYTVTRNQRSLDVYWIRWQQDYIWGVTAGIIHTLYSHLFGHTQTAERT